MRIPNLLLASMAVLLATANTWATSTETTAGAKCGAHLGIGVLVSQDTLYLERPGHQDRLGGSAMKAFLLTALTGAVALVFTSSEPASQIAVQSRYAEAFRATAVAQQLDEDLARVSSADGLPTVKSLGVWTRGEDADAAIDHTTCKRVVVVNTLYTLEESASGVQLAMLAQLIDSPPETTTKKTLAVIEYRSTPFPFRLPHDTQNASVALDRFMADHLPAVESSIQEGVDELARMTAYKLSLVTPAQLAYREVGSNLRRLECGGCRSKDWIVLDHLQRVWLEPREQSNLLRSLPWRPPGHL